MIYLKYMIQKKGYTISDIAKLNNVSDQTISNWINNRNSSSILKFLEITYFLNFSSDDYKKLKD